MKLKIEVHSWNAGCTIGWFNSVLSSALLEMAKSPTRRRRHGLKDIKGNTVGSLEYDPETHEMAQSPSTEGEEDS